MLFEAATFSFLFILSLVCFCFFFVNLKTKQKFAQFDRRENGGVSHLPVFLYLWRHFVCVCVCVCACVYGDGGGGVRGQGGLLLNVKSIIAQLISCWLNSDLIGRCR